MLSIIIQPLRMRQLLCHPRMAGNLNARLPALWTATKCETVNCIAGNSFLWAYMTSLADILWKSERFGLTHVDLRKLGSLCNSLHIGLVSIFPHFVHSFSSLSHDRSKLLPKLALHILQSKVSFFKWQYPLFSLRSSSTFLRLLRRLPFTSILLLSFLQ
jgi:hypothetical protein